ncbi:hypothetical protein [Moraxella caviae]|uniref:hypothetical protein n=1 Tax=Moraxella caviae TaxID=34060 RepID=UPI00117D91E5|nr:hypothetical protein [Moraxella caviae]
MMTDKAFGCMAYPLVLKVTVFVLGVSIFANQPSSHQMNAVARSDFQNENKYNIVSPHTKHDVPEQWEASSCNQNKNNTQDTRTCW